MGYSTRPENSPGHDPENEERSDPDRRLHSERHRAHTVWPAQPAQPASGPLAPLQQERRRLGPMTDGGWRMVAVCVVKEGRLDPVAAAGAPECPTILAGFVAPVHQRRRKPALASPTGRPDHDHNADQKDAVENHQRPPGPLEFHRVLCEQTTHNTSGIRPTARGCEPWQGPTAAVQRGYGSATHPQPS